MSRGRGLRVSYETAGAHDVLAGDDVLAVFTLGQSPLDALEPRHVPVALRQLGGAPVAEVWRGSGPVETGEWEQVTWARCERMTMAHIALDLRRFADMRNASQRAYALLQSFLRRSDHHCPMKIWNYIPGINEGEGDAERYRQFCVGRAEALAADPGEQPPLPAATAIGTPKDEPALQIYMLATARPGTNVENPRQVNAWHYPRRYGPRSPLFSRGTLMQVNGDRHFLISGTASVVGHETHHDNTRDQIAESVRNVESLMEEARRLLGSANPTLGGAGVLRVYLRHAEDLAEVREALGQQIPHNVQRVFLHGDICRSDLLTEIDGIIDCAG